MAAQHIWVGEKYFEKTKVSRRKHWKIKKQVYIFDKLGLKTGHFYYSADSSLSGFLNRRWLTAIQPFFENNNFQKSPMEKIELCFTSQKRFSSKERNNTSLLHHRFPTCWVSHEAMNGRNARDTLREEQRWRGEKHEFNYKSRYFQVNAQNRTHLLLNKFYKLSAFT